MHVSTVVYYHGGFWVSPFRYHNPGAAIQKSTRDWYACGSPGWYGTEANKRRYEAVAAQCDLTGWYGYDGEHELVSFEIGD